MHYTTILLIITIAAHNDWELEQMDIEVLTLT